MPLFHYFGFPLDQASNVFLVTACLSTSKREISEPLKSKIKIKIKFSCIQNIQLNENIVTSSKSANAGYRENRTCWGK